MAKRLETLRPTHTVAGCLNYTNSYHLGGCISCQKTHTDTTGEVMCGLCDKAPESVAHVLAGCSALAQNKYVTRHNAALKIVLFKILQDLGLVDSVPARPLSTTIQRESSRLR